MLLSLSEVTDIEIKKYKILKPRMKKIEKFFHGTCFILLFNQPFANDMQ